MTDELLVAGEPVADGRPHTHFEIKARVADPAAICDLAARLGAAPGAELIQNDAYFRVPHGRLKLREVAGAGAQLMFYERKEDGPRRWSDFRRIAVANPAELRAVLAEALGLRGVVAKRRQVFLWRECRIHLDHVEGLGAFVELELESHGDAREDQARMEAAMAAFNVRDTECVCASYADLLGF